MPNPRYKAVLWDFGGVITESPFDAFRRYELRNNLPADFIRMLNAQNPDSNAWARFERSELSLEGFDREFALEAEAAGYHVPGRDVVNLLYGPVRPKMVGALRKCRRHYRVACLTNNVRAGGRHGLPTSDDHAATVVRVLSLFDVVIESSKVGARKPELRFYQLALQALAIEPHEAVYLDDLGVNLKPARALGMTTIKVEQPDAALAELEQILDLPLH
ncbi:MAG TPA: HAD-IA family hydrolase [Burkholderiales bacterium]|nr:HAD-IA family hydrolase [Burkholderiales bacterium]